MTNKIEKATTLEEAVAIHMELHRRFKKSCKTITALKLQVKNLELKDLRNEKRINELCVVTDALEAELALQKALCI
jgi:hypothetical protein